MSRCVRYPVARVEGVRGERVAAGVVQALVAAASLAAAKESAGSALAMEKAGLAKAHDLVGAGGLAGAPVPTSPGSSGTGSTGTGSAGTGSSGTGSTGTGSTGTGLSGRLQAFEGFLKKAGQVAGVVLSEIVKYVVPVVQVAAIADPAAAPALEAFTTSLELVQTAVVTAQQRWVQEGSAANSQKLADVLEIVEQPIVVLFAQAGISVDTAYVTNLVNGVVAILNSQPAVAVLPAVAAAK